MEAVDAALDELHALDEAAELKKQLARSLDREVALQSELEASKSAHDVLAAKHSKLMEKVR